VVCVDVAGRGKSDWLKSPELYANSQSLSDMSAFIAHVDTENRGVTWLGSSMGGGIGQLIAASPNSPIRRLIINDIGPVVSLSAIKRIASYIGLPQSWATIEEGQEVLSKNFAGQFGPTFTQSHWAYYAKHSLKLDKATGRYIFHYDPEIKQNFQVLAKLTADIETWSVWAAIRCPVLVLHGRNSDVLTNETCAKMESTSSDSKTNNGRTVKVIHYEDTGHLPPLVAPEQIEDVYQWLRTTPPASFTPSSLLSP